MLSGEDMVEEDTKNQPKVDKLAMPTVSGEEGAPGLKSPSSSPEKVKSLYGPSSQKFISFSKFLGLPVNGNEKEIASLLRKLESKKRCRDSITKKRLPSTPH